VEDLKRLGVSIWFFFTCIYYIGVPLSLLIEFLIGGVHHLSAHSGAHRDPATQFVVAFSLIGGAIISYGIYKCVPLALSIGRVGMVFGTILVGWFWLINVILVGAGRLQFNSLYSFRIAGYCLLNYCCVRVLNRSFPHEEKRH
jgi:hypothetical protein